MMNKILFLSVLTLSITNAVAMEQDNKRGCEYYKENAAQHLEKKELILNAFKTEEMIFVGCFVIPAAMYHTIAEKYYETCFTKNCTKKTSD